MFSALASGGRQIIYSAAGGRQFNLDVLSFYRNRLRLLGLNTQPLGAGACAAIFGELVPLFESGALAASAIGERYRNSRRPRPRQPPPYA
jgi:NADPH:quinone reductase-like Zn-dependent oxidoreductase